MNNIDFRRNTERANRIVCISLLGLGVLFLPIFYALSVGPAAYFLRRGVLKQPTFEALYAPLNYAQRQSPVLRDITNRYAEWWFNLERQRKQRGA